MPRVGLRMDMHTLGVTIPGTGISVSWVVLVVVLVIGFFLIRAAFTVLKVVLVVAAAIVLWFLAQRFL